MCHFYVAKAAVNTSEPKAAVVTGTADWDRRETLSSHKLGVWAGCSPAATVERSSSSSSLQHGYHNVVVSMSPLKSANQTACEQYFQPFDFKWKHS